MRKFFQNFKWSDIHLYLCHNSVCSMKKSPLTMYTAAAAFQELANSNCGVINFLRG